MLFQDFVKRLCVLVINLLRLIKKPMKCLRYDQHTDFDNAKRCHICNKGFKNDKIKNHDFYSGEYLEAAHKYCELNHSKQRNIPVVFHNGSKYDFNLLITELAKEFRTDMNCIPKNIK